HYEADTNIWKNYINESAFNIDWLQRIGVKFKGVATLGAGVNTWHLFDGLGKKAIHDGLQPFSQRNGVEFITSASAISINRDKNNEIIIITI
ncbi:MAG: FAD-dependent oxidoreductase, partial [Lactobacillaceae bacterium]